MDDSGPEQKNRRKCELRISDIQETPVIQPHEALTTPLCPHPLQPPPPLQSPHHVTTSRAVGVSRGLPRGSLRRVGSDTLSS